MKTDQEAWQMVLEHRGLAAKFAYKLSKKLRHGIKEAHGRTYYHKLLVPDRPDKNGKRPEGFFSWGDIFHLALIQLYKCCKTHNASKGRISTYYYASLKDVENRRVYHRLPLIAPPQHRRDRVVLKEHAEAAERSRWWVSLYSSRSNNGHAEILEELIEDEKQTEEQNHALDVQEQLTKADRLLRYLYRLNQRDVTVFLWYVTTDATLKDIASGSQLSRERIRQIANGVRRDLEELVEREQEGARFTTDWNPTPNIPFGWMAELPAPLKTIGKAEAVHMALFTWPEPTFSATKVARVLGYVVSTVTRVFCHLRKEKTIRRVRRKGTTVFYKLTGGPMTTATTNGIPKIALIGNYPHNIPSEFKRRFNIVFHHKQDDGQLRGLPLDATTLILTDFTNHSLTKQALALASQKGIKHAQTSSKLPALKQTIERLGLPWADLPDLPETPVVTTVASTPAPKPDIEPTFPEGIPETQSNKVRFAVNRAFVGKTFRPSEITATTSEGGHTVRRVLNRDCRNGNLTRKDGKYFTEKPIPYETSEVGRRAKQEVEPDTAKPEPKTGRVALRDRLLRIQESHMDLAAEIEAWTQDWDKEQAAVKALKDSLANLKNLGV